MRLVPTKIPDLWVAETEVWRDARGGFARLFCARDLKDAFGDRRIVQINHSSTIRKGTVRGLHFQYPPYAEMKLVRCIRGRVWDVAVDLRRDSPTFLQWHAEELSPDNARMLVIPEGFAHGFQALEDGSEMLYLHTAFYAPDHEGGVRYDDPMLNIRWPLPVVEISARDRRLAYLGRDFEGLMP